MAGIASQPTRIATSKSESRPREARPQAQHEVKVRATFIRLPRKGGDVRPTPHAA